MRRGVQAEMCEVYPYTMNTFLRSTTKSQSILDTILRAGTHEERINSLKRNLNVEKK